MWRSGKNFQICNKADTPVIVAAQKFHLAICCKSAEKSAWCGDGISLEW
jgi:hypothetical protein